MPRTARRIFGDEGVLTAKEACDRLRFSRWTLGRRIEDGTIDARSDHGRLRVCKRSIEEYLQNLPEA